MNRERWMLLISIGIFVAVGFYHSGKLLSLFGRKAAPAPASKPVAGQPVAPAPGSPPVALPSLADAGRAGETVDRNMPWGRVPFWTQEEEAKFGSVPGEGLRVKAIIVGRPKSVATIDGRTVTVGEKVGEETVREIRSDAVILERDGHTRMVKVSEPAIPIQVKEPRK